MSSEYQLRPYQDQAIEAAKKCFESGKNGILVLPTGSGKSLVIASICSQLPGRTIVLQPTKEILEQNKAKIEAFGCWGIGVYSASCGRKDTSKITCATIGSVIRHKDLFDGIDRVIVDECHLVNSKGGMYEDFIRTLDARVIGLTATPYRLSSNGFGAQSKILTRTRPRIFNVISHVTQVADLFAEDYLCPLQYQQDEQYRASDIKSNSTGQGYDDRALLAYNQQLSVPEKIAAAVQENMAKHCLVFTKFRQESGAVIRLLRECGISSMEVSAETPKREREQLLRDFRSGVTRCVVNVGVLTTGFDFPELDCVVLGRPTKSVALYYQMTGRGIRPAPDKGGCLLVDLCDNVRRFGKVETFRLQDKSGRGLWELYSDIGLLTGVDVTTGMRMNYQPESELEQEAPQGVIIPFGKYKDKPLGEVPVDYLQWCVGTFDSGKWRSVFERELARRCGA